MRRDAAGSDGLHVRRMNGVIPRTRAGFYLLEATDLNEALQLVRRIRDGGRALTGATAVGPPAVSVAAA
ncbi:hypothetical protein [Aquisalimonas asiatica]|uniref:Uncharacterized protein n=1 Tax=Aquisalimonas asiatica TaxID=406100 RepID=A0A1H8SXQ6_9GAMM|nr:hypothetical protein [Aquisalimonas asiatica]SEO82963.1 hypothetical protein SAMN04488052_103244 [Aquisalimonas asiatica]